VKVLLVTSMYEPYCGGGVSSHVGDLSSALARAGHEVTVLSHRRGRPRDPAGEQRVPAGVRAIFCRDFRDMFVRLRAVVRHGRYDVVHYHSFNALALAPLAIDAASADVFTLHSDSANYLASVRGWTRRSHPAYRTLLLYERVAGRLPDVTIAVSRRMKAYGEGIGIRPIVHIPNAVDGSFWTPNGGALPKASPTIVVPRMHVPKNGIEYAIEAMPEILAEVPDAVLVVTGDGPLRPALEAAAARAAPGHVRFAGLVSREDLRELYRAAYAVVIPSVTVSGTQENTSIAALEGMACGTVVVATDIGGLPEVIRDGEDGFLVPERDSGALADRVLQCLRDEGTRRRVADAARARVEREFAVSEWAERVARVYEDAIEANGRPSPGSPG